MVENVDENDQRITLSVTIATRHKYCNIFFELQNYYFKIFTLSRTFYNQNDDYCLFLFLLSTV